MKKITIAILTINLYLLYSHSMLFANEYKCLDAAITIANKLSKSSNYQRYNFKFRGNRNVDIGGPEFTEIYHVWRNPLDDWEIEMTYNGCFPVNIKFTGDF